MTRRTKTVKIALDRMLPFIGDCTSHVPKYEGNGYWLDHTPTTDSWYSKRTVKVFIQNAWLVVNYHPDPEAVRDAIRWNGDPHALERQVKVHHEYMKALKWLTMDDRYEEHTLLSATGIRRGGEWHPKEYNSAEEEAERQLAKMNYNRRLAYASNVEYSTV